MFELVKQWTGLSNGGGAGGGGGGAQAPGIAQLAGMFGLGPQAQSGSTSNKRNTRSSTKRKTKSGSGAGGSLADTGADIADILRSATGTQSNEDWQDVAQGYVKQAVAKAAGLEWLFGGGQQAQQPPAAERRRTR